MVSSWIASFLASLHVVSLTSNPALAQQETVTLASARFVVDPAEHIVNGMIVAPGSAAISIDGQLVSADPADDVFMKGVEVLTRSTSTHPGNSSVAWANNTVTSFSHSSFTNGGGSGSTSSASQSNRTAPGSRPTSTPRFTPFSTTSRFFNVSIPASSTATTRVASQSISVARGSSSASGLLLGLFPSSSSNASMIATTTATLSSASQSISTAPGSTSIPTSRSSSSSAISSLSSTSEPAAAIKPASSVSQSSATTELSLSSNGTASGTSSLAIQVSASISISASQSTAVGSSSTTLSMISVSTSITSSTPSSITSGPQISVPVTTLVPTGSAASAAGISLGFLVLGIAQEAKTLSAVVTDSPSRSAYLVKIQGLESKWENYFRQIGGGDLPSYHSACTGGGLFGLLKLVGCIGAGLGTVVTAIEAMDMVNPGPVLAEVEGVIATLGTMAEEEQKEEEEDDDNEQSTQNKSEASETQRSSSTPSSVVSSSSLRSSTISSSVSSSASSSASTTDSPCDTIIPQGLPAGYMDDDGAAQVVLEVVGDILLSVLGGDVSGFTTSKLASGTSSILSPQTSSTVQIPTFTAGNSSSAPSSIISSLSTPPSSTPASSTPPSSAPPSSVPSSSVPSSSTPPSSTPPSSTILSSTPLSTLIPVSTTQLIPFIPPPPYQCTMIVNRLGRYDAIEVSTCTCDDGSKPTPTPTAKHFECPSQVASIVNDPVILPPPNGPNPY